MVGEHDVATALAQRLADGERGGQGRRRRMREQAIDPVGGDRELRVVIVVGVNSHAVGERREARRDLQVRADHRGRPALGA